MTFPRLSDSALVRRHAVDGVHELVVHDARSGALYVLTPEQWALVRRADGMRTLDEIAAADGGGVPVAAIAALFNDLTRAGLLEEGPRIVVEPGRPRTTLGDLRHRTLVALADFAFTCDGAGECCSGYSSLSVTRDDLASARACEGGLADVDANEAASPTPLTGAEQRDHFALPLVDGRCFALNERARCTLHERGGPEAKPRSCRTYPTTLLDDGDIIRVSVTCECSCVFRSRAKSGEGAQDRWLADLPSETPIHTLADLVPITVHAHATREAVARWSRSILELRTCDDGVELLLNEARRLRERAEPGAPHEPDELTRAVEALANLTERGAIAARAWRSAKDPSRISREACAAAAGRAASPGRVDALRRVTDGVEDELLFARAMIYGCAWGAPLADGLVRAAARLMVSRELRAAGVSEGHPIALIERVARSLEG